MTLSFANPSFVHAPLGLYSHTVSVPEGTELLFISGQVGVRPDGTTPPTMAEQADQVFSNIIALLRAHELGPTDIVKLTTFMVAGQDGDAVRLALAGIQKRLTLFQHVGNNVVKLSAARCITFAAAILATSKRERPKA